MGGSCRLEESYAGFAEVASARDSTPDPVAEVAEGLAVGAFGLVAGEDRDELGDDLVEGDVVLELDVEPVAEGPAAEEDGVGARSGRAVVVPGRRAADQADVGVVRPGAAVGAAGHPDGEAVGLEPEGRQSHLELVHDRRQGPLGLGHGQAAGRHRRAGHRPAADGRIPLDRRDPVRLEQRLDLGLPGDGSRSASRIDCWQVIRAGVLYLAKNARRQVRSRKSPSSLIRPFSTGRPRNSLPSPCSCQPRWSSTPVTDGSASARSRDPAEILLDLGRKAGIPQSKTRYLIRARLRSERLPKSR